MHLQALTCPSPNKSGSWWQKNLKITENSLLTTSFASGNVTVKTFVRREYHVLLDHHRVCKCSTSARPHDTSDGLPKSMKHMTSHANAVEWWRMIEHDVCYLMFTNIKTNIMCSTYTHVIRSKRRNANPTNSTQCAWIMPMPTLYWWAWPIVWGTFMFLFLANDHLELE